MARLALAKPYAAFLDLIGLSEGTVISRFTHDDGYDIIVTGVNGPNTFLDYSAHPFASGRAPILVRRATLTTQTLDKDPANPGNIITTPGRPPLESTASGRYQITLPTWRALQAVLHLNTFSPRDQDLAAMHLLTQRAALVLIDTGNIAGAIQACCQEWASFPGNDYGQGGQTEAMLLTAYQRLLTTQP
jgi:muramidase (phage lysozyme)